MGVRRSRLAPMPVRLVTAVALASLGFAWGAPVSSAATRSTTAALAQPTAVPLAGSKAPTVTSAAAVGHRGPAAVGHHDPAASGSARPATVSAQATPAAAGGTVSAAAAAAGAPGYTPLSPYRVLDTRSGVGAAKAAVGTRGYIDVKVLGVGGVPATGVDAVAINVTVTAPTVAGWVAVYPSGAAVPTASNLNFTRGLTVANLVIAKIGTGGSIRLYNYAGSTHLVADLAGYMATGSAFTGQTPVRILDTRNGTGATKAKVGPGQSIDLAVAGAGGVPATGVAAVAMNVTATNVTTSSFVTVFPTGTTRPNASNLNLVTGQTVPVLVMATLGGGHVSLFNAGGSIDLIADVAGWYTTGGEYHALTPSRVFDSRQGFGALPANSGVDLQLSGWGGVPLTGDAAVVLSLTAVTPTSSGFLTEYPYSPNGTRPTASNLNFTKGAIVPNLVIAKVGAGGWISIYNPSGNTHVIIDVTGWFSTTQTQGLRVGQHEIVTRDEYGNDSSATSVDGVSGDGRYTMFTAAGASMEPSGTITRDSVYVRDAVLGITTLVATDEAGPVTGLGLSSDGRYALWKSTSSFVAGDKNSTADIYLSDLLTGWWYLASWSESAQAAGGAATTDGAISPNGRYVALISAASDLAPGDNDGVADVFVVDMWAATASVQLVAPATAGGLAPQAVADDGSVTYTVMGSPDAVYVWNSATKASTLVSRSTSGDAGIANSDDASISADGRYVAFETLSALDTADVNGVSDIYLHDTTQNTTTLVTAGPTGAGANGMSLTPMISADGSAVVFSSFAGDLTVPPSPGVGVPRSFRYNRSTGITTQVSTTFDAYTARIVVSAQGTYVAHQSDTLGVPELGVLIRAA